MKSYHFCLPVALFCLALFTTSCKKEVLDELQDVQVAKINHQNVDAGSVKLFEATDDSPAKQAGNPIHTNGTTLNKDDVTADNYPTTKQADTSGGIKLNSDDPTRDDYPTTKQPETTRGTTLNSDSPTRDDYSTLKQADTGGGKKLREKTATPDAYRIVAPRPAKQ